MDKKIILVFLLLFYLIPGFFLGFMMFIGASMAGAPISDIILFTAMAILFWPVVLIAALIAGTI